MRHGVLWRLWWTSALVLAAAVGSHVVGADPVSAGGDASRPVPHLTVTTTGGVVSLSGDGCVQDGRSGTVKLAIGPVNDLPVPVVAAGPDGTWSVKVSVPEAAAGGRLVVTGVCVFDGVDGALTYPAQAFPTLRPSPT
jgi:hypothetical protein